MGALLIEVALQPWGCSLCRGGLRRPGAVGGLQRLVDHGRAAMRVQEDLNQACAVLQGVTQVSSTTIPHLDDVAQGNGLSRQFRTNGPTEKALVMGVQALLEVNLR